MIYELRTYKIFEGRMPAILNRFENITFPLFDRHGIEVVGFWTRSDANELVYLCRFKNEEEKKKRWAAFFADPQWIEAKARTEAKGRFAEEIISHILIPTSFSAMQ